MLCIAPLRRHNVTHKCILFFLSQASRARGEAADVLYLSPFPEKGKGVDFYLSRLFPFPRRKGDSSDKHLHRMTRG